MGKKLTTQEFIEKARAKHGDTFKYDKTCYQGAFGKVTITCRVHGDFTQVAGEHVRGSGCAKCVHDSMFLNTEDFVFRSVGIHGGKYDYSQTEYVNNMSKVKIVCPEHGVFEQIPASHLRGNGCDMCGGSATFTTEDFVRKSREKHGDAYDYSRVTYINAHTKVDIVCHKHGVFKQEANSHMRGIGCPSCSTGGFNPDKPAFVYFLLDTETHSRVKIGVSNSPDRRLQELKSRTPFTLERIDLFETPSEITLQIEALCHYHMESANLKGFDGATEWFKFDGGKLEALRSFILSFGGAAK